MQRRAVTGLLYLALAIGTVWVYGCGDDVVVPKKHVNEPPETELTFAPIESDTTSFRVRFFWNGYDRDGEVSRFRYAVDDQDTLPQIEWPMTENKDTVFAFLVDPINEIAVHRVKVAAEDNLGAIDPTPAGRQFSAKTVPPTSRIERGPSAFNPLVGPNFTYEWSGIDPDGGETGGRAVCDSFEYMLLLLGSFKEPGHPPLPSYDQNLYVSMINQATGATLQPPYDDWAWTGISDIRNRFRNQTTGEYVFGVRAVDIAGATEKGLQFDRNIRHFTVTTRNPGPILRIRSSVLNTPLDPTSGPNDSPRRLLQIFEGETISFSWSASADTYGGEVVGYTYALDDTSSFPGIDLLLTGVTFTPSRLPPGNHFLYVRAVDDGGLVTNAVVPILIVHPAFKDPGAPREVLYVDDSLGPGNATARIEDYPSDIEETNWWTLFLLPQLGVPVTEWDTYFRGITDVQGRKAPEPRDLAAYTTVIWNVDFNNGASLEQSTGLWKTLVGGNYSELSGYLRAGGTLILTGFSLGGSVTNPNQTLYSNANRGICFGLEPGSPAYNLSYFPRLNMGVDGAIPSDQALRSLGSRDFIAAYPTADGAALGYDSTFLSVGPPSDATKKWHNLTGSDLNSRPGLPRIDGWVIARNFGCKENAIAVFKLEDPTVPIARPIFTYHGARIGAFENGGASPREGMVCGVQVQAHDLGEAGGGSVLTDPSGSFGRMVHIGFPLYFMYDDQSAAILINAFNYVNASPTLP